MPYYCKYIFLGMAAVFEKISLLLDVSQTEYSTVVTGMMSVLYAPPNLSVE